MSKTFFQGVRKVFWGGFASPGYGPVGRVCHQSILSEPFPITGGLKQGCVLSPTCFSLYVAAMLNEVPPTSPGINLRYRMDRGFFNLSRFRARSKTSTITAHEPQFANDTAVLGNSLPTTGQLGHEKSGMVYCSAGLRKRGPVAY